MAGPSGPGSGSSDLPQQFPGRDGSRPPGAVRGTGRSSDKGETSQLLSAGFEGCRAPVLPLNALPKAAGSHQDQHIPGCSRRERGFILSCAPGHCGPAAQPSPGTDSLHQHHSQGWSSGFFYCSFFPSPLSLSLFLSFWPIFVFCRGSGVFLKQLFRRRLLSDGRSVGKSSLPPAIAPPTRPALLLLLGAAAAFWSMQRNTAPEGGGGKRSKNSPLQPTGAPLLPEGSTAKWVR